MAKEELLLPVEMEKLEIDQVKHVKSGSDENPFICVSQRKRNIFNTSNMNCSCSQRDRITAVFKKKSKKILKEPVLNFVKQSWKKESPLYPGNSSIDNLDNLCSLVDNCNQLKISSSPSKSDSGLVKSDVKWWNVALTHNNKGSGTEKAHTGSSCSQQALNPPCDITIDELASYFETLVHIPKKMSSMAEMMYI